MRNQYFILRHGEAVSNLKKIAEKGLHIFSDANKAMETSIAFLDTQQ